MWTRTIITVVDLMTFNWDNYIDANHSVDKGYLFRQPFKK